MKDNRRFGSQGVYTCRVCGKKTRETGMGESDMQLCAYCMEASGMENAFNDGACTLEEYNRGIADLNAEYNRSENPYKREL